MTDMNAIEGVCSELAARTDRPQGYPFSRILIYTVAEAYNGMKAFAGRLNVSCSGTRSSGGYFYDWHIEVRKAEMLPTMRKLDFKKAGKVFGARVQEMKNRLDEVPEEFITTASRFDPVDGPKQKTTGCRKYLVEAETADCPDQWEAIRFRKAVKKYVTEDLGLNIVPPIFGDKYPEPNLPCVPRVTLTLGNCKEMLYQALEGHGEAEFSEYPIRLVIHSRRYIAEHLEELSRHHIQYENGTVSCAIDWIIPS